MSDSCPARLPGTVPIVRRALREDIGKHDLTTEALVPEGARSKATIIAKSLCVVAGVGVATEVFRQVDPALTSSCLIRDGNVAEPGAKIIVIEGSSASILTAERTALNFMQRMCGIATLTRRFVDAVKPCNVSILDTRKTTPGLRILEKHAVLCGGGKNHRMGLYDMVLIKDNHRRFWSGGQGLRLDQSVAESRRRWPGVPVEIEVESEEELRNVLPARPDWVLLDNMSTEIMSRCVSMCNGVCRVEASGGITLETVSAVARTGVNAISIGALTHSAPAADLSLELVNDEDPAG